MSQITDMSLNEKYRPTTFEEVRGQDEIVNRLREVTKHAKVPNMLFVGPPGSGKTSMAEIVARVLFGDTWKSYITEVNASDKRGIDEVREKIKPIAELMGKRIIFLDEFDRMTRDAQWALRRIIEPEGGTDTLFILAANHESMIEDAIKSRCAIFRFKRLPNEVVKSSLIRILKGEGIELSTGSDEERQKLKEGFEYLVDSSRGDLRSAINVLESLIKSDKKLTVKDIAFLQKSKVSTEALRTALKGDFEKAKELFETAYNNNDSDAAAVCDELYDSILELPETEVKKPVKVRLYIKLAESEGRIRAGSDPKIQLIGFFAFAWLAPHLKDTTPQ